MADVRLRRDQANAKRLALINQRDLLQARLKSAEALVKTAASGKRKLLTVLSAITVLVLSITLTY